MSRGTKLQEMEESVANPSIKQSKTAVNANASPGMPMEKLSTGGTGPSVEDLGGPTPENYSPTNASAQIKSPGATLKQVSDVVTNRKGKTGAMPVQKASNLKQGDEAEIKDDQEIVSEEPEKEEAVVAEEEVTSEYDVDEDVNALLGGEDLSEEFKAKAKTIFEAALNSKVAEIKAVLDEEYAEKLEEGVAEAKAALAERVDSYLEYVSDEWFTENQLAVEGGLKEELTESFLTGMKNLFEEHYVSIPDDKYDVLESMVEKLDDMETKLNEQIEKNIGLNKRLAESVADGILDEVSDGLAATQKEKLASLSESVEFASEEEYREKLEVLKESYFSGKSTPSQAKTETLSEGVDVSPEIPRGAMANYLKTLQAFKPNN